MTRSLSLSYVLVVATVANLQSTCGKGDAPRTANHASVAAAQANWSSLGATACDRFLTPDVTNAILSQPAGPAKRLSAQACSVDVSGGSLSITLIVDGPAGFDAFTQNLTDPQPLAGVGDKALRHMIGIAAFKSPNMVCTIDAVGAPGFLKLSGAALGQALGAVCNKLFAATP